MKDLISKTRTYRRFIEPERISRNILEQLVELARLGGSARNSQPWQYLLVTSEDKCEAIFPHLGWAAYLKDWKGPNPGERPSAYILCYLNTRRLVGSVREAHFDLGIFTQNMLLGATEAGLGGCRIGAFNPNLANIFDTPDHLELHLVLALGIPGEEVLLEDCESDDIKYWHDEQGRHHVPKRLLADLILNSEEI